MSNPNTAAYPGAIATDNTLLVARDDSTAFLSAPVGISDLTVTLTDASTFNTPCSLSIDAEILYSPSNVGNVFTVQRGFDGSTPSVHATGTAVFGNIIAWHHNQVSAEIKAIESTLGINLSNIPTGVPLSRLINTTTPLAGGGNLSADLTLSIATATTSVLGVVKPDGTTITISGGVISSVATGSGTVTSVALTAPSEITVAGSPITTSGTLALSWTNESANRVFAGPATGSAATPAFRSLVAADIPSLAYVPTSRLINTTAPLAGGGNLSADLTISVGTATTSVLGVVKPDGTTITIAGGVISAVTGGSGTVTSIALTVPGELSVTGSPITTSGTLAVSWTNETANFVLAGPTTGAASTPAFRALVLADIPALPYAPTTRLINTTAPLAGGGNLSADLTLSVGTATTSVLGVVKPDGTTISIAAGIISAVNTGTVTSVGLSLPAIFTVTVSPVTANGTLTAVLATELANLVFAGPTTGAAATPTFRALVNADMPGSGAGSGTVTSVGLSLPAIFSVTVSPVTASGTLTAVLATQSANTIFSGPTTGAASAPTFRSLVVADIPSLSYVPTTRLVSTTTPLAGGGNLSADLTLTVGTATTSVLGVVKPDGTTITIAGGIITATAASAANKSIELNGIDVSDDWVVTVNSPKQVTVNGV